MEPKEPTKTRLLTGDDIPARVLVVDDVDRNLKLMEAYLSKEPVIIEFARDGVEALEKLETFFPDIVLLDVQMPRMDGFEACRHIKADEKTFFIPVIMVTAMEQSERIKGLEAGADDFLTKPVNRQELLVRMRGLLKLKRMHDRVVHYQQILESLFEITSFSERYQEESVLLRALSEQAALLLNIGSVGVVLQREDGGYGIAGGVGLGPEMMSTNIQHGRGLIGRVLAEGTAVVQQGSNGETLPDNASGFVGIPLKNNTGTVIGALFALGNVSGVDQETLRILSVLGYRLASELQAAQYSMQLESMVQSRTEDLHRAFRDITRKNIELTEGQEDTIFRLSLAAEYRDEDTAFHLKRISAYSEIVAKAMNLSDDFVRLVKMGSIMHDVGKIGIPDSILLKRGRLTQAEFEEMKRHPLIGARILSGSGSELLKISERIAISHHERYDGFGYPYGLVGEDIPLAGRIVAIADVFDALTTPRVYKPAFKVERALEMIGDERAAHFDPMVTDAFFDNLETILRVRDQYQEEQQDIFLH